MNLKLTTLSLTCALALAACGGDDASQPAQDGGAAGATQAPASQAGTTGTTDANAAGTAAGTTAATGAGTTGTDAQTAAAAAAGANTAAANPAAAGNTAGGPGNKPEATVADCATTIQGDDAMQFSVGSITVPASCSEFTITLEHVGKLPVAAMGHNVVISAAADRPGIATDGMAAGVEGDYVKDGDDRVIAHTELVGGGESTSVTFPVSKLQGSGPYEFFCSFPGHWAVMRGTIQVG